MTEPSTKPSDRAVASTASPPGDYNAQTHPKYRRRFSPTVLGIVAASFVQFLKRHEYVKWLSVAVGVVLIAISLWLGIQPSIESGLQLISTPPVGAMLPLVAGGFLLYLCALAGPGYEVFVAEAPEAQEVKIAQEKVEQSPTLQAMLELDSKRLAEYYAINQSQARWSFFWAVVAFVVGFGTILAGIWQFYLNEETRNVNMAWLTTIAGVVTNAISGMFLYLYNQIHGRSLYYYNQLARVQLMGVAIHLAETHAEEAEKVKSRNKIITEVLNAGQTLSIPPLTEGRKRSKAPESDKSS